MKLTPLLDCPLAPTTTCTVPAICEGDTALICVLLATVADAATPPNETLAPDTKFDPLIVTVVPPDVGPELGEMLLITGVAGGAMLALNDAEAVCPVESFTCAENPNVPACVGVPLIVPDPLRASPGGNVPPATLHV